MDSDTQRDAKIRRLALAGQTADEISVALGIPKEAVFDSLQRHSEYGRTYVMADLSHSLSVLKRERKS